MSVHGFEAGRSRELWQEVLPGPLALFQALCGLGTVSLNSDLPVSRFGRVAECDSSVPVIWFRGCLQSASL